HLYFKLCYNKPVEFCDNNCAMLRNEKNVLVITFSKNQFYESAVSICYPVARDEKMCVGK
ncbi:MAG: hypothetical protein ACK4NF_06890, partial [Planctomycetota bacterium]